MTPSATQPAYPSDEPSAGAAFARLPILDAKRAIVGYELVDPSGAPASPEGDAQLLAHAAAIAGHGPATAGERLLLVRCQLETLMGDVLDPVDPERLALELALPTVIDAAAIEAAAGALEALRRRGFRVVLPHGALASVWHSWLAHASHLRIDLGRLPSAALPALAKAARQRPGLTLIVTGVSTPAQHAEAAAQGVPLFQGPWFAEPVLSKSQTLRPSQATVLELIGLLRKQAETAVLEEVLKRDPALSFNLLRYINSSGFGLNCEITSFRHALMIMGYDKLLRWCCMLIATARAGAAPAVGQTAVVRGRLMELLASELLTPEECDQAFVVGVFSLLDTMTGVSLERALHGLPLADAVLDALLRRHGVLAPFLALTEACESADEAVFAQAAQQLQLSSHQVNMAHLQALAWTEDLLTG